jgi:hypothetical protein
MDIAILAPLSALPKVKKLAQLFRQWGGTPKSHRVHVLTTAAGVQAYASVWQGMDAKVEAALPGVVRQPPMSDNEPFFATAKSMTSAPWFYLTPGTVPITPNWADKLEQEYLASGKPYLGVAGYLPQRYRDSSGIDRVSHGDPFILEAAIYPASMTARAKATVLSRVAHHEVSRRYETYPNATLSEQMFSANWNEGFRLKDCPKEVVVVTRLLGDHLVDELLGLATAPAPEPEPEPVTETRDSAPTISFPVKEPTIRVISSSQMAKEATSLEKRPRGRPKKS